MLARRPGPSNRSESRERTVVFQDESGSNPHSDVRAPCGLPARTHRILKPCVAQGRKISAFYCFIKNILTGSELCFFLLLLPSSFSPCKGVEVENPGAASVPAEMPRSYPPLPLLSAQASMQGHGSGRGPVPQERGVLVLWPGAGHQFVLNPLLPHRDLAVTWGLALPQPGPPHS